MFAASANEIKASLESDSYTENAATLPEGVAVVPPVNPVCTRPPAAI